jgi:hypothetical protein
MINIVHQRSRGQALILVAFGMVALVGMTALAIDGGSVYSDRRHAQNAADTAAMAAGLTHIRNPSSWSLAYDAGMLRAAENGYDNNGTSNVVNVYLCTDPASTCALPAAEPYTDSNGNGQHDGTEPYTDTNGNGGYDSNSPDLFVQATITSHVPTYFARVLGLQQLTNAVQALAVAIPGSPTPWYNGNALVATMPGCKTGGWPNDPFTISGNSLSLVNGSGVFVNSNCSNAFTSNNNTTMSASAGICVVGGVVNNGNVNPPPDDYCGTPIDLQAYTLPSVDNSSCPSNGQIYDLGGGNYVATAGRYNANFPNVSPAGNLKLQKGIYCFQNGISFGASWNLTTDIDGNGTFDGSDGADEGVVLYVHSGAVTFNGGTSVQIGAINKIGTDPGIKGYLLYLPPTNTSTVKLAGSNGSTFIGTVLAPASLITLEGGTSADSLNLECQIIGYSLVVTGGGTLNINYYQNKVGTTWSNPVLVPYR